MDDEMRAKVYEAAKHMGRAYLATSVGGQPWLRPVQPAWDGNDLWIGTWKVSPKIRHLRRNPRVQLFYEVKDDTFQHLRVTGVAELVDDIDEKRRAWNSFDYDLAPYFQAPEAPGFALIRIRSSQIMLASDAGAGKEKPLVWRLHDDRSSIDRPLDDSATERLSALASAAGLEMDAERLMRLGRQWIRLMDGPKLLGELDLAEAQPAALLPQREVRQDE